LTTLIIVGVLVGLGLGLVLQSDRFHRTPAYANLLGIMSADNWGYIHLGVAVMMLLGLVFWDNRALNIASHTVAGVLLLVWEAAFIIRYLTDSATTVVNVMSWGAYLFLLLGSATTLNRRTHRPAVVMTNP
jgi:hypothetical protein